MTPIPDILAGFKAGAYSQAEAEAQIQEHLEAAADRTSFAASALQGMLATGIRPPSKVALAQEAFAWADCMVECSKGQG